ncbi:MAG: hypothetical protein ACYSU0_19505 [Planctomycetota bacterium]|jgi:hypothetical protein
MTGSRPSLKRLLLWITVIPVALAAVVLVVWRPSTPNNPREMVFTLAFITTCVSVAVWALTSRGASRFWPLSSRVLLSILGAFFVFIGATAAATGRSWEDPEIGHICHPSGAGEGILRIIFGVAVFALAVLGPKIIKRLAHNPGMDRTREVDP